MPAFSNYVDLNGTWLGYGPVNFWHQRSRSEIANWLNRQVAAEIGVAAIEMLPWLRYDALATDANAWNELAAAFDRLVSLCRQRKVWLFVSICNDNKGRDKYGDTTGPLRDYTDLLHRAAASVKAKGPEGLLIQPVAERALDATGEAGRRFEEHCKSTLTGFRLVYNAGAQTLPPPPPGFQYVAHHPGSTSAAVPSPALNVSDHGDILRQLNANGDVRGFADVQRLEEYATRCVKRQGNLRAGNFTYYGFWHSHVDYGALRALEASRIVPPQASPTSGGGDINARTDVFRDPRRAEVVVSQLSRAIIGRDPGAQLAAWRQQVVDGYLNRFVSDRFQSQDFAARRPSLSLGELTEAAYQQLLRRAADRDGRAHTVEMLHAGNGVQRLAGMALSPEYAQRNP